MDEENAYLCGYLKIKNLTDEYPEMVTFFDGEIISEKHPFLTRKWDADEDVDRKHWVRMFWIFKAVDPDSLNSNSNPDPDLGFQADPVPDPIRIQGFDDKNLKNYCRKFCLTFLIKNCNFTYVRATGKAFSPQKRTSSTSKNEFY